MHWPCWIVRSWGWFVCTSFIQNSTSGLTGKRCCERLGEMYFYNCKNASYWIGLTLQMILKGFQEVLAVHTLKAKQELHANSLVSLNFPTSQFLIFDQVKNTNKKKKNFYLFTFCECINLQRVTCQNYTHLCLEDRWVFSRSCAMCQRSNEWKMCTGLTIKLKQNQRYFETYIWYYLQNMNVKLGFARALDMQSNSMARFQFTVWL